MMIERSGNLWDVHDRGGIICVTTNGIVKPNGALVMGAGIALEASVRYPWLRYTLGRAVKEHGLCTMGVEQARIIAFPTKYDYRHDSQLSLIRRSATELVKLRANIKWQNFSPDDTLIYLGRPGCGYGRMSWSVVGPVLHEILADDVYVSLS